MHAGGWYGRAYKMLDLLSLLVQVTSLIIWSVRSDRELVAHPWSLPLGLALTSFGWWEAYLPYDNALIGRPIFAYLRLEILTEKKTFRSATLKTLKINVR
jgi:hypothetical protein